jgi:hypothetical protein
LPTFAFDFLLPKVWNPPIFIRGGKWTFYLYWCQILALDSVRKDPNRGLKMVIMNYQIWQLKTAWVSFFEPALRPLWCQSATKNYTGVWSSVIPSSWCMIIWFGWEMKIKCSENVVLWAVFSGERERRQWTVTRQRVV